MKSSIFAFFIRLLLCLILTTALTSSASFPNPPQLPSANASAEEWAQFMKFLHNYYAIIARPRFGKRYDPELIPTEQRPLLALLRHGFAPMPSSGNAWNEMLHEDSPMANHQAINLDDFYTFSQADRRRRR